MASTVATASPTPAATWTKATAVQTQMHFIKIFTEARIRNRMFIHIFGRTCTHIFFCIQRHTHGFEEIRINPVKRRSLKDGILLHIFSKLLMIFYRTDIQKTFY